MTIATWTSLRPESPWLFAFREAAFPKSLLRAVTHRRMAATERWLVALTGPQSLV